MHDKIVPNEVIKIAVIKQDRNIDVLCIINHEYAILPELVDRALREDQKQARQPS